MNRIRYGILAHSLFDHHPPIPLLCQILPDSPCPPFLSQTLTSPQIGRDGSPQRAALTTSTTRPAPPPGSIHADRAPSPLVRSRPPPRPQRPPRHCPIRRRRPPSRPLPPLQRQMLSPYPKDGKSAKPQTAAPTSSTTTAGRPPGSTLVSQMHPALFSLLLLLRPPSISALFLLDGRCA